MKTILIFIAFATFSGTLFAQCPTAGQDTAVSYCKNELFDVSLLRSADADLGGAFIDPADDTMTTTTISLMFPGQYTYFYKVSGNGCPVDSAKYVITILNCNNWGLSENALENNALIHTNPVSDQLLLNEPLFDHLEIYETSGRRVLSLSGSSNALIDISQLEGGNYILLLDKNGKKQFQRFLKY